MAILKCKICGGDIDVGADKTLGTCQYCGTTMTIPLIDSDKKARLFNRAIQYLNNCEFDKAYSAYESIVSEDEHEAEAYWGMILSEYGIEYVEDPREKRRIPTCHRTRTLSPKKTTNYNLAIKNASDEQRALYIKEADEIERIQNDIKSISSKEKPYDVFICYKYSDEEGNPTEDSVIAHEIYDSLEQSGLRVFFSKITLEDKLGTEYEPYIYAALRSAKILILVTTKTEYCDAIWVKNEWLRYLEFMAEDKDKTIIPVYKNITPANLPPELQKFQGLDISKLGAHLDLKHAVKKQIEWSEKNGSGLFIGGKRISPKIILLIIMAAICCITLIAIIIGVATNNKDDKKAQENVPKENIVSNEPISIDTNSLEKETLFDGTTPAASENSDSDNKETTFSEKKLVKCTGDDINVRSTNSTDGSVLGKAKKGEVFDCVGEIDDWYHIIYNGQDAYIKIEFMSDVPVEEPKNDEAEAFNPEEYPYDNKYCATSYCKLVKNGSDYYLTPVYNQSSFYRVKDTDFFIPFDNGIKIAPNAKVGVATSVDFESGPYPVFTYEYKDFYDAIDQLYSSGHWEDQEDNALFFEVDGAMVPSCPMVSFDEIGDINLILDYYSE